MCHKVFQFQGQTGYPINTAQVSEDDRRIYEFYFEEKCAKCNNAPGTEGCAETDEQNGFKHTITIPPSSCPSKMDLKRSIQSLDYKSINQSQHQDGQPSDWNKVGEQPDPNQGAAQAGQQSYDPNLQF